MSKLGMMVVIGASLGTVLLVGLTMSSSARVTGTVAADRIMDPNAMMKQAPLDLPMISHPIL